MIPRILFGLLLLGLTVKGFALTLPEITSYAKVSKNGQETISTGNGPFSWITRTLVRANVTGNVENEGRSAKDIVVTVSPVYVPPRISKLKNSEIIDYPSTKRYSTIDEELLAKLDSTRSKSKIQDRFHPPASFEHNSKQQIASRPSQMSSMSIDARPDVPSPGSSSISAYSRPPYPMDSYKSQIDSFENHQADDNPDFSSFSSEPSYDDHAAPKPIEFDKPTFVDDTYPHDHDHDHDHYNHHHHHQEVIYDHLPDYHHHHHYTTTPRPEMNDQRLDKRPYSYYFIGKKLWYIPLYFSIYFIVYIAALVLKSIARHKITFPSHLAEAVGHGRMINNDLSWWDLTNRVFTGIEDFSERFGKGS
ncbi:hypothetical protein M0802_001748 [Mischocyttarus mexicanus]|nr:hypothetical protein M0802_001748 [Mischocyttarus mexicanus]